MSPGGARPEEPLAAAEVFRRASGGAALLAARGVIVLGVGLVANIVLARLLEPRDFGLMALGSVLLVFGGYFAEGGLGAALIRREEPPTLRELEAVNGVQLTITTGFVLVFAGIALQFGDDGAAVAAMVASLPLTILRSPSLVVLQRRLEYRAVAAAELLESLAFYVAALTLVALGLGIWGVVVAMAVRAAVGTATVIRLGPVGLTRPRWDWSGARPYVGFGARVQLLSLVGMVREQGLNVGIASIAGIATLGVWNLAFRVLQVPTVILTTATRVTFPAVARLLEAGRDPRAVIERGVATLAVAIGLVVVAMVGFAPALPALVGEGWDEVPATLAWSSVALLISGPVYVLAAGHLFATDDVGAVIRAALAQTATWFAIALPLVPQLGAEAIGLGWIAAAAANALMLAYRTRRRTGAAVVAHLLPPVAIAVAAGAAGWAVASAGSESVLNGVAGALTGELTLLAGLALMQRPALRDAHRLMTRALGTGPA